MIYHESQRTVSLLSFIILSGVTFHCLSEESGRISSSSKEVLIRRRRTNGRENMHRKLARKIERFSNTKMTSYTNNAYGYQRTNPMAYLQPDQGMMGSAGVYGGAPVVSFPAPPAAPLASQAKPYYRCWDNNQKKWFYWEKDSSVTTWTEPAAHITIIDHETGSVVQRDQPAPAVAARPAPAVIESSTSASAAQGYPATATSRAAVVSNNSVSAAKPAATMTQSRFQPTVAGTINPNYSAGVSRYTQSGSMGSNQSGMSAAEKARLEEADRLIAEQLQKQLSMEAEAELVASCPLPGEAAKLISNQKKKFTFTKPAKAAAAKADEEDIADMAKHGFVVKKQKPKKAAGGSK